MNKEKRIMSIINVKEPVIAPGKGTSAVWASQQGRNKSIAQSAYEAQHRIYKYTCTWSGSDEGGLNAQGLWHDGDLSLWADQI